MKIITFLTIAFLVVGSEFVQVCTTATNASPESRRTYSKEWWEHATFYQIYPRSFMDSNNDGVGDIRGITSRLEYLKDLGIDSIWLSPVFQSPMVDFGYDVSDFYAIHDEYGTMEDFDEMMARAKSLEINIMLDFVPNHSSDKHDWFVRSVNRENPYTNYYVWRNATYDDEGIRMPPNNWVSVFGGRAWTWNEARQQYYLHQFYPEQPDLNYREPLVIEEMMQILQFWLQKGAAGFRIDAINHMFENEAFLDEPLSWGEPDTYDYLDHIYTKDQLETYDMVHRFRTLMDDYAATNNVETKILMTEAYANISFTMLFYESEDGTEKRANMPYNFGLIYIYWDTSVQAIKARVDEWLDNMPSGNTPNWVIGSHDHTRVASRVGVERIDLMNTLSLTLPGTSITYYGEEIGMLDYYDFEIKDSRDPNRTPMQWDDTTKAGFSTAINTWLPVHPGYVTNNVKAQQNAERSHLKYYQELTALRQQPTMIHGDFLAKVISSRVFAYIRFLTSDHPIYTVVINYHNEEELVDLSVFASLPEQLEVAAATSTSTYRVGDKITTNNVLLMPYDAVIFTSAAGQLSIAISLLFLVITRISLF